MRTAPHSRPTTVRRSGCPISIALELLGDAWSLLIVRDLMFKGRHSFNEFLDGGEGIATNILADRLRRLEAAGIVEKQVDPSDRRRIRYGLTRKGIDLAPVLVELVVWSANHEATDAPADVVREMQAHRRAFLARVRRQWAQAAEGAWWVDRRQRPDAASGARVTNAAEGGPAVRRPRRESTCPTNTRSTRRRARVRGRTARSPAPRHCR